MKKLILIQILVIYLYKK